MERMMHWVGKAHGIRFVSLRYFNVGGAWPGGIIGEDHRPESHLIPVILQVPLGRRETVTIFGNDYATPDGTCIRDYLGVMDLADAHMRALDYLRAGGGSEVCNLGNGKGFSVREMVAAACRVTGHDIGVTMATRRYVDPARLVLSRLRGQQAEERGTPFGYLLQVGRSQQRAVAERSPGSRRAIVELRCPAVG